MGERFRIHKVKHKKEEGVYEEYRICVPKKIGQEMTKKSVCWDVKVHRNREGKVKEVRLKPSEETSPSAQE